MLSQRIINLQPSATLAVGRKAKEMVAAGLRVLNLSVGEPDLSPPREAKEALAAASEKPAGYTDSRGTLSLRRAICYRLKTDFNLEYQPEEVVVSCGSKHTLYNLFQALINPGDEVLIPVPYWTSYPEMVRLAAGTPVFVQPAKGFKVQPEDLEKYCTARTKIFLLNSPNNPSGVVYQKEELKRLADWVCARDILVISDDAYQHFLYDNYSFTSIASFSGMRERTLIVAAVSKTYAMTGWRIGWLAGPAVVADAVAKLQDQSTSNPASPSQEAAEAALYGDQNTVHQMRLVFAHRRQILLEALKNGRDGLSYPSPEGAFYLFFTHPAIKDSAVFSSQLLEKTGVALVPGVAFGMEGYLRLSYAAPEDILVEAAALLKKALT